MVLFIINHILLNLHIWSKTQNCMKPNNFEMWYFEVIVIYLIIN